ncbi:hypothetical protein D3C73_1674960 [compost metagenome]
MERSNFPVAIGIMAPKASNAGMAWLLRMALKFLPDRNVWGRMSAKTANSTTRMTTSP